MAELKVWSEGVSKPIPPPTYQRVSSPAAWAGTAQSDPARPAEARANAINERFKGFLFPGNENGRAAWRRTSDGTVDVLAGSGTYQPSTQYTILNSPGGVTGHFTDVTSNLAFLTPTLTYDQGDVFLTLKRNDTSYGSVGITPNQIAVGTALQNATPGAQGNGLVLITAVNNLSAAQAPRAFPTYDHD